MKITGKDLLEMGYRQGQWFREALDHVNAERMTRDELKNYLDSVQPVIIDPHETSQPYPVSYTHLTLPTKRIV